MFSRYQRSKVNQSPVLFTPDSVVGLLTLAEPGNGNATGGSANIFPHSTLWASYPFQAAFGCYGSTSDGTLESNIRAVRPQIGANRAPIVGSKNKNELGFNHDLAVMGSPSYSNHYGHVEFALTVFLKNVTSTTKTKTATGFGVGSTTVEHRLFAVTPNSNAKGGVTSCVTSQIASGSNNVSASFNINAGQRLALMFTGRCQAGTLRYDSASNNLGYQNSLYAGLSSLHDLINSEVVIDHELTALAMTRTFERDFMLWNL